MNTIIAITGRRGSFKTCLMTALGYIDASSGRKVYSNYHLTYDYIPITLKEVAELPKWLYNATVLLDEIQVGADAREIFKPGNKGINTLATQLRKRRITLYYTTQKWTYPDKRLREQVDFQYHCEPIGNKYSATHASVYIYDRTLSLVDMEREAKVKVFPGHKYWGMYDTEEVITYDGEEEYGEEDLTDNN